MVFADELATAKDESFPMKYLALPRKTTTQPKNRGCFTVNHSRVSEIHNHKTFAPQTLCNNDMVH